MADKPLKSITFPGLPDRYVPEGGGTSNYNDLTNKPSIGGVTVEGNKSPSAYGIAAAGDIPIGGSSLPKPLGGSAKAGTSAKWSREDHVHKKPSAADIGALPDDTTAADLGGYVRPAGGIPKTDLASGVQDSLDAADSAYQKPSGGIPASDLAQSVQDSLDLADTALQSFTETDPTVPAWAKAQSKPTYTASEVGALPDNTVIPTKVSDLTNDSGFVNAAGAASAAPVQSVNGQTGTVTITVPSTASDVGAVASNQGVSHAGEFVVVGSDGNITTVTMTAWAGGSY